MIFRFHIIFLYVHGRNHSKFATWGETAKLTFFFLLFSNFDWEFHLGVISEMQFGGFGCVTEVSEDQANLVWGQERQGESHSL